MSMKTLYYCPGHLSFAPHVILNEIGEPFETVSVSIKSGATQSDTFRRLNPKGKVPVLDTGSQILTESSAIMCYLALLAPERALLPPSPLGIARAIEWTNWLCTVLASVISQTFHPQRFSDDADSLPGIKKRGLANVWETFSRIDDMLNTREWALEEAYSIVDPMLLIFYRWGNLLHLNMRRLSYWSAHTNRMEQRPAVQATLKAEGISIWE
jgi:glutathione S-transferase